MPGVDKPGTSQYCANCERLAKELETAEPDLDFEKATVTLVDLTRYAMLQVRKSAMPPGASLVVCYEVDGVPRLDDARYPEFVVVRKEKTP